MSTLPTESWEEIFGYACTDDGYTGRSLSLVSTYFHDISAPFKYQSLAVTHWSKILAFSQIFCNLPASQRRIKYLFVHHPYPFLDVDGPAMRVDQETDESDSESDSDFEGSLDSEEERELMEEVAYLKAVRDGFLPLDGNARDEVARDAEIEAFFDKILQAFRAILDETSSTLTILAVYWTSFRPLQMHELLPPLPHLEELHIYRTSDFGERDFFEEPPTTVLFPQLLFLYVAGDNPRKLSFSNDLARVAPNLTHLRFSMSHFSHEDDTLQTPTHVFSFHRGLMIVEHTGSSDKLCRRVKKRIKEEFGSFEKSTIFEIGDTFKAGNPKIWKSWWESGIVGDNDGLWGVSFWSDDSDVILLPRDAKVGRGVIHP